jgi:hypothetical protein
MDHDLTTLELGPRMQWSDDQSKNRREPLSCCTASILVVEGNFEGPRHLGGSV